jgi:hypothetical protein
LLKYSKENTKANRVRSGKNNKDWIGKLLGYKKNALQLCSLQDIDQPTKHKNVGSFFRLIHSDVAVKLDS